MKKRTRMDVNNSPPITLDLFRKEALDYRLTRLQGSVVLRFSKSTRLAVVGIVIAAVALFALVARSQFARTEMVRGILTTSIPPVKITPTVPGTVASLSVSEGTVVRAGQILGALDLDRRDVTGAQLGNAELGDTERELALASDKAKIARQRDRDDRTRYRQEISSIDERMAEMKHQIALAQNLADSNEKLYRQIEPIVSKGYYSRFQYEQRRQAVINSQVQLSSLKQQLIALQSDRQTAEASLRDTSDQTARDINETSALSASINEKISETRTAHASALVAPIDGRVTSLDVGVGQPVRPDAPIFVIVPRAGHIIARFYAPSKAMGSVRVGQSMKVMYDAFPYREYGSFSGHIVSVSATAIDPRDVTVPLKFDEPVYILDVELDNRPAGSTKPIHLEPGMTATGSIVLEKHSLLSWLLAPLTAVKSRG